MTDTHLGGTFANDFRILQLIGEGGMGAVYAAEQISTGRQRALKVMHSGPRTPQEIARFMQEARIGSRIASDHIVDVVAAGVDDASHRPWLAMELLAGKTLEAYVESESKGLTAKKTATLFEQLCHGVGAAHNVGVVHRDIKPSNIFVADGRVAGADFLIKVLDFGIAKSLVGSASATGAMGTVLWMAPEQASAGSIGCAADVWALGLIAFYALTGHTFWKSEHGEDTIALFTQILQQPIPAASLRAHELGVPDKLPNGFDAWFSRCVVREVSARYPTANEMVEPLLHTLNEGSNRVRPTPLPTVNAFAIPDMLPNAGAPIPAKTIATPGAPIPAKTMATPWALVAAQVSSSGRDNRTRILAGVAALAGIIAIIVLSFGFRRHNVPTDSGTNTTAAGGLGLQTEETAPLPENTMPTGIPHPSPSGSTSPPTPIASTAGTQTSPPNNNTNNKHTPSPPATSQNQNPNPNPGPTFVINPGNIPWFPVPGNSELRNRRRTR